MKPAQSPGARNTVIGYFLCCALVPLYVNLFPLWKYVSTALGNLSETVFIFLPALILMCLLALCWTMVQVTRKRPIAIDSRLLIGGVVLCIIGLLVPDPAYPVKRIHVAEYAALSLVARFAMSSSLSGLALLFYSSVFAALLGIHDEFLQGLHPARTYGLQDMAVNALGSCGGGLIWHGLTLFSCAAPAEIVEKEYRVDIFYLSWLGAAVSMLVLPAYRFKGQPVELWTTLPLLAALVYFLIYKKQLSSYAFHGITALTAAAVLLIVYPFLSWLPGMFFY